MNTLKKDGSGLQNNYIGLAPIGVATIAADTEINHLAIVPSVAVNVYFDGDGAESTFEVSAGTAIVVHSTLRLAAETSCLVY